MNIGDRVLIWIETGLAFGDGNMWAGGLLEGTIWYIKSGEIFGVRLDGGFVVEDIGAAILALNETPLTGLLIAGGRVVLEA